MPRGNFRAPAVAGPVCGALRPCSLPGAFLRAAHRCFIFTFYECLVFRKQFFWGSCPFRLWASGPVVGFEFHMFLSLDPYSPVRSAWCHGALSMARWRDALYFVFNLAAYISELLLTYLLALPAVEILALIHKKPPLL